eukprot:TRINITY_DN55061_c0_g1_i1.p1 TRINITY_DN55061_c0_g1~~TRINITY_DN55061_c0_g1_i1.p1  ORF type:complete len:1219 (+),score=254.23 TRINITY_DN55061_c0_g1_i1:318-3974(+)
MAQGDGGSVLRKRILVVALQTAKQINSIFVKITLCAQLCVLPQVTSYEARVIFVYLCQLVSNELMLVLAAKGLAVYFHSSNFLLLLSVGAVIPFFRVVRSVWTLIPCPPIASYISNLALVCAFATLLALGLGTYPDYWEVYVYLMSTWPWLVLSSLVSRLFIERTAGSSPFSPIRDLPFLGVLSSVSCCLSMIAVKNISLSDCLVLTFLDPILAALVGPIALGKSRVSLHSKYIKIYSVLMGMAVLYTTGDSAGFQITSDHAMFIAARFLQVLRSFYVKWAYATFYKAGCPPRPAENELLFYNFSAPRKHRFERFPEPMLLTLDAIFDSGMKDTDFHGMGPLGTVDLYNLTEAAYLLPIASLMANTYEGSTLAEGLVKFDRFAGFETATASVAGTTEDTVGGITEVADSVRLGGTVVAIAFITAFCLARVLTPSAAARSLFDKASAIHSWHTRRIFVVMPFFFADVLWLNEQLSKFQIVLVIMILGVFNYYQGLLWAKFKKRYYLFCTQELQYCQPSCTRKLQRETLLDFLKNTSVDDYGLLLLQTTIRHGQNIRELARDTGVKVWDPPPSVTAAWKLAFSLVRKSLQRNALKKKLKDEKSKAIHSWISRVVEEIVERAVDIAAGHGSRLRHAGVLADMFAKRRAVYQLRNLARKRRGMRAKKKNGQLAIAPMHLATTSGVLRQASELQPGPPPAGMPAIPPPPRTKAGVGTVAAQLFSSSRGMGSTGAGFGTGSQMMSLTAGSGAASAAARLPGSPGSDGEDAGRDAAQGQEDEALFEAYVPPQRGVWAVAEVAGASTGAVAAPGGTVVVCFGDGKRGQLALEPIALQRHVASGTPVSVVEDLRGYDPVQIEAGGVSSFVVGARGHLWAFGSNRSMELGQRKEVSQINGPQRVKTLREQQLVQVSSSRSASGQGHTLFLVNNGLVYTCGTSSTGALGQGVETRQTAPLLLRMTQEITVKLVAAGAHHSVIVTDEGRVFTFGDNNHGQLGLGDQKVKNLAEPAALDVWTRHVGPIKLVAVGDNHNMALAASGKLYTWGSNATGQLGLAMLGDQFAPKPVRDIEEITSLACGSRHSLVVSNNGGKVWSWGSNTSGQLGVGPASFMDGQQRSAPALVKVLSDRRSMQVTQVAAAACHSLALTRDGEVFAFGDNSYGQLGFLPEGRGNAGQSTRATREVDAPHANKDGVGRIWTPERVVGLSLFHVRAVATAEMHSIALCL